jgi:alpha-L-rhamnosidase
VWDERGESSGWSAPSHWAMGLLQPADWTAAWIAQKDIEPLHTDRTKLHLPAARHYRKEFTPAKPVRRAVVYAAALGIYDLYCNGQRIS